MKIILSGANGFLGKRVFTQLNARGHTVIPMVRSIASLETLSSFDLENSEFILFDIEKDRPEEIFIKADAFIHLAWGNLLKYNDNSHVEIYPQKHLELLVHFANLGIKNFTVTGTSLEYGLLEGELLESMLCEPVTQYGIGKLKLYNDFVKYCTKSEISFKWLRLFYMYAEDQRSESLLGQLAKAYMGGAKEFNMSSGDQIRDYLHADAVADAITKSCLQNKVQGIINVGSGKGISVLDVVNKYLSERNAYIKLNRGYYPYPTYEPFAFWANVDKLAML